MHFGQSQHAVQRERKTSRVGVSLKLVTHPVVDAYGDHVRSGPELSGTPAWVLGFPLARHDSDPDSSRNCALDGAPSRAFIFVNSLGGLRGFRRHSSHVSSSAHAAGHLNPISRTFEMSADVLKRPPCPSRGRAANVKPNMMLTRHCALRAVAAVAASSFCLVSRRVAPLQGPVAGPWDRGGWNDGLRRSEA